MPTRRLSNARVSAKALRAVTAEDGKAFFELAYGLQEKDSNEGPGLIYSRISNSDLQMLEDRLAIWDQAEAGLVFASGMAAISTTLWA